MKRKMMEAMEYMDQKYINEALEYKEKKVAFKPLLRWGAVAACLVLVVTLTLGLMGGLPGTVPVTEPAKEIVLPPVRVGEGEARGSLLRDFSMQEAYKEADLVAWVRVGNWLSETEHTTQYEAEIVECYKGDVTDPIVLYQSGSSKCTYKGYELHTYGNELLVFLARSPDPEYPNHYYSIGAYSTEFDIVRDIDGKVFVRGEMHLNHMLEKGKLSVATHNERAESLYACMIEKDSYKKNPTEHFGDCYALEDIVGLFS